MHSAPPLTGRDIALQLQQAFPGEDWMAKLAVLAGDSRDTVEWHLQEDMPPPEPISKAAAELLAQSRAAPR
jgi:hypothetical protein